MGGRGSGSYYRWHTKSVADGCRSIDVNWLNRNGFLNSGSFRNIYWSRNGERTGDINIRAESGRIVLEYRSSVGGGDWENVTEPVLLSWTKCNYGGHRPWFVCPRVGCGRRVGKLFSAGKYFLCRHCYDLAYETQNENPAGRNLLKAQNIRRRLGGSMSMIEPFPDKPKRMHWRTYYRLWDKHDHADRAYGLAMGAWIDRRWAALNSDEEPTRVRRRTRK